MIKVEMIENENIIRILKDGEVITNFHLDDENLAAFYYDMIDMLSALDLEVSSSIVLDF